MQTAGHKMDKASPRADQSHQSLRGKSCIPESYVRFSPFFLEGLPCKVPSLVGQC